MGNHHKLSKVCIEVLDATQVEKRTCKKASKVINNKTFLSPQDMKQDLMKREKMAVIY